MYMGEYRAETVTGVLIAKIIAMEARCKALEELLIEKGTIDYKVIEGKYQLVMDRDSEQMRDEIFKKFEDMDKKPNR